MRFFHKLYGLMGLLSAKKLVNLQFIGHNKTTGKTHGCTYLRKVHVMSVIITRKLIIGLGFIFPLVIAKGSKNRT